MARNGCRSGLARVVLLLRAMTNTNAVSRMDATGISNSNICYCQAPTLQELMLGAAILSLGHQGDAVMALQMALNATGLFPLLALDGLFGHHTQNAVRGFQGSQGMPSDVPPIVDLYLWVMLQAARRSRMPRDDFRVQRGGPRRGGGPRRAPRFGARAPEGSLSAGQLQRADEQRIQQRTRAPARLGPTAPTPGQTPADAELAAIQSRVMDSARREIGVREIGSTNRGQRVDEYARRSRMPTGHHWCGFFTGFNYDEAARELGGSFRGINGFHSMQKARSFFEYRSYTDNSRSTNQRLDSLREQHRAEGSTRRWMVLDGSGGHRHATTHNRPHEVYEPSNLPIRAGDTALFSRGHVGLVESYDRSTGQLTTIEGNTSNAVRRRTYDLNNPSDRAKFEGFGRPARSDFEVAAPPPGAPAPADAPAPTPTGDTPAPSSVKSATPNAPAVETNGAQLDLPPRPANAETGSEFLARTRNMSRADRERAILQEIESGNVPSFARQMKSVEVSANGHTATMNVMPDYLAIGSDDDFVRIPMNPDTAQRIADRTGTSLPTTKIVDDVYANADVRMTPQPIPPSGQMMSNNYFERHHAMVEGQRNGLGAPSGALTAGHKKDVVLSNRGLQNPDKVAIYGWHRPSGKPIQPLSTLHIRSYADYSHGVRLVDQDVVVDGRRMRLEDALRDPELAPLFSNEGVINRTQV